MKRLVTVLLVIVMVFGMGGSALAIGRSTDKIERGVIENNVYENAFLGIGCELDEDWVFYTDEEIAENNGIAVEMLEDEELQELLEENPTLTEMWATYEDGILVTGINIENLGLLYGMVLDEDAYIDLSLEGVERSIEAAGLEDDKAEKITIEFAGAERSAIRVTGMYGGEVAFYQTQVCIKVGSYMALILLQSSDEDLTEELAGLYYALEPDEGEEEKDNEDDAGEDKDEESEKAAEPVHFIEAMGDDGAYAYVDVIGISDWVYFDGIKRYYAAEDEDYFYIVSVRGSQLAEMGDAAEYWNREEDSDDPPVYTLTGYMGTIDEDAREAFKYVFDLDDEQFDTVLGEDYLDATPIR